MSFWVGKQLTTTIITTLLIWLLFILIIRYRGKQSWGAATGKGLLLALQTGLSVGTLLFCCMEVHESPMHKNFSLVSGAVGGSAGKSLPSF